MSTTTSSPMSTTTYATPPSLGLTILDRIERPGYSAQSNTDEEVVTLDLSQPAFFSKHLHGVASQTTCCAMLPAFQAKVRSLPGNDKCCDCGAPHPEWASTTLACLVCLKCAGAHRSLGVCKSRIRSLELDSWSSPQILRMLAGGNACLHSALRSDGTKWAVTGQPISASNAHTRYDCSAATQYTQALDAKCSTGSDSSDEDEAPSFGQFMRNQVDRVRRTSSRILSPCVDRIIPDTKSKSKSSLFCCIGASFTQFLFG